MLAVLVDWNKEMAAMLVDTNNPQGIEWNQYGRWSREWELSISTLTTHEVRVAYSTEVTASSLPANSKWKFLQREILIEKFLLETQFQIEISNQGTSRFKELKKFIGLNLINRCES